MGYYARIEADSLSPRNSRLTTAVATYPREVLAEAETHRMLQFNTELDVHIVASSRTLTQDMSKNSASSRAIPTSRMLRSIKDDPWVPFDWQLVNPQGGMQAGADLSPADREKAVAIWLRARDQQVANVEELHALGVAKQRANRLLEPFAFVTQVITATDVGWANFFTLRCHKDAAPPVQRIARMLYVAYRHSSARRLDYYQWHLPFLTDAEWDEAHRSGDLAGPTKERWKAISAGRTARVSYLTHDGKRDPDLDVALADRLRVRSEADPVHASPFEHVCTPMSTWDESSHPEYVSNLKGWKQMRREIPRETAKTYRPSDDEYAQWEAEFGAMIGDRGQAQSCP